MTGHYDNSSKSNGIARNTTLLYLRMIVVMLINLYAVRLLFKALGVEDYGIYNVVAGVITMLSCVSSVLAMATQRYYSYAMGENSSSSLRSIFSASLNIFIALSVIVIILGETIGIWFLNTQLVIPTQRLFAAHIVYQASIISFIFSLLQVPYSAAVIAHEHMGSYALISTIECLLKFFATIVLLFVYSDRLILYGCLLLFVQFIVFLVYFLMCRNKYKECHYLVVKERDLYKELVSFSGWTLFGSVANVGMIQGNTLLINIFFGPIANSARAISLQVYNAITSFCNSFVMALRPPMIKSYAENELSYLFKVFNLSNKLIYYCFLIICIPLFLEMDTILGLWLGNIDNSTIVFSKLTLIYTVIISLHNPITIIIQATGHVKEYYVPVEIFTLLSVPATYVLYRFGYSAESTVYVMIIASIISHFIRLFCLKKQVESFSIISYIKKFIVPAILISIVSYFSCSFIHSICLQRVIRLILVSTSSIAITLPLVFFGGFSGEERMFIKCFIKNILKRLWSVR